MKKILIAIFRDDHLRNLLSPGFLEVLKKEYDCYYLLPTYITDILVQRLPDQGKIFRYKFNKDNARVHADIYDILTWRHRKKSSTFAYRLQREYFPKYAKAEEIPSSFKRILKKAILYLRALRKRVKSYLLSIDPFFHRYFGGLRNKVRVNPKIEQILKTVRPDLVIALSMAYEPDGIDILGIASNYNFKTLFLIDNWDNLSSKTILWRKPDHIAVWGRQNAEMAIEIQGFEPSQVAVTGTARYDQYFTMRGQSISSPFDFKYILYAGTALPYDEVKTLKIINEIMKSHPSRFAGIKLIYRPHIIRPEPFSSFNPETLENVLIDPQLKDQFLWRIESAPAKRGVPPDLDYYPALLQNAEFVTGGLTSMLIEACIFYKRFLALVHDEPGNLNSPRLVWKNYLHFRGLENLEAITFCQNLSELEVQFLDTWDRRLEINRDVLDTKRRYFCYDDEKSYGERIADICRSLLKGSTMSTASKKSIQVVEYKTPEKVSHLFWAHQLYRVLAVFMPGRWRQAAILRRRACVNKRKAIKALLQNTPDVKTIAAVSYPSPRYSLWQYFINNTKNIIQKVHHYFPIYEQYFSKYINHPLVFWEIGVFKGGSLQMWKQYFGPQATIIGIDINENCKNYEEDNIHICIGDQSDHAFLEEVLLKFGTPDIVLDDGSHKMSDIKATFDFMYDKLPKNGLYIVEDLHTAYWEEYEGGLGRKGTFIEYCKGLIDELNAFNTRGELEPTQFTKQTSSIHFYDSLIVFERSPHTKYRTSKTGAKYL